MSWIINGLAFVGCLTLIAIALLAWAVWRDDTPPTTATHAQTDATKQAHDLAAFYSAVAMTRRAQEARGMADEKPQAEKAAETDPRGADGDA